MDAITIPQGDIQKLLGAASGDAALLYIFLQSGGEPSMAAQALRLNDQRLSCAASTLRQLGLWDAEPRRFLEAREKPLYSEQDVLQTMQSDLSFRALYGEVQRRMGRVLNTEELKILLSIVRYLGLPADVICILVSYCQDKARHRGCQRNPSLRAIEKEAYFWAEQGIDTTEAAAAYIQRQNVYHSRLSALTRLLQIRGRNLTAAEEKYARQWLEMGFADEVITMAYERTCLNTGGLNWAYMNKILQRWHQAGLHTAEAVRGGDRKDIPKGASGQLGQAELDAIQRILKEDR